MQGSHLPHIPIPASLSLSENVLLFSQVSTLWNHPCAYRSRLDADLNQTLTSLEADLQNPQGKRQLHTPLVQSPAPFQPHLKNRFVISTEFSPHLFPQSTSLVLPSQPLLTLSDHPFLSRKSPHADVSHNWRRFVLKPTDGMPSLLM